MSHSRPTQCDRIKAYIKKFGSISTLEAFVDLGIVRLGARISEMRKSGIKIDDQYETVKNRYGEDCHIKRYYIKDNENRCLYCNEIIPEGRQVCPKCEKGL